MSRTEIVLLLTTLAPVMLGAIGSVLRASSNQRLQAVGATMQAVGVDIAKARRSVGDARRGVPLARRLP